MSDIITVTRDDKAIKISSKHRIYRQDTEDNFDFYFEAVEHTVENGIRVVDYSTPKLHNVIGFDLFPVFFPFTAEPVRTTDQYLNFANLKEGDVVLDLGAYSGLTAIIFKQQVGATGKVIAVEADEENLKAVELNFNKFKEVTGMTVDYIHAAAWNHCNGLTFSTEGAMGSMVADRARLGAVAKAIPSVTLSELANIFNLERVDFIKCDIEGAERVVFDNPEFFKKFRPKIIIELHHGAKHQCSTSLTNSNYSWTEVKQEGSEFPLVECVPV